MNTDGSTEETLNIAYNNGLKNTRTSTTLSDQTDFNRTYNGFSASGSGIIDHILCSEGMEVKEYHTIDYNYPNVPYLSDHYPIYSIIKL
jgi:endonuclease/exonuclease/phosphatase family metal-dependent hydrolase